MKFEWTLISNNTVRAKVFGGWIVRSYAGENEECMVFIPDPEHEWRIIG